MCPCYIWSCFVLSHLPLYQSMYLLVIMPNFLPVGLYIRSSAHASQRYSTSMVCTLALLLTSCHFESFFLCLYLFVPASISLSGSHNGCPLYASLPFYFLSPIAMMDANFMSIYLSVCLPACLSLSLSVCLSLSLSLSFINAQNMISEDLS
jgi:hypothetical protein